MPFLEMAYNDPMDELNRFLSTYPVKTYRKGAIILHQDDEPTCVNVVKSGIVKIYDISAVGDERLILFDQAGEFFPIAWMAGFTEQSQFFYEAHTDATVYRVPRQEMVDFLQSHPSSLYAVYLGFIQRYITFQARILSLEQAKASDKVLFNLNFLLSRFGHRINDRQTSLKLPFTQQDLANFVGLTRETTSIELKKLENQGVIQKQKNRYVVYIKRLRSLLRNK
jgi:CRP/FNR family transcriptional regulator